MFAFLLKFNAFMIYLIIFLLLAALLLALKRQFFAKGVDMKNKTIVITGGSSGLGLALAQCSLNYGASQVFLLARNEQNLIQSKASLSFSSLQKVHTLTCDVTKYSDLQRVFNEIKSLSPAIDFLFANAGSSRPKLFQNLSEEDFISQVQTNYLGAAFTVKQALPLLSKGSHVVFSGSVCSVMSFTGYSAYAPTKYALKGLADSLRNELSSVHVHIGLISSMNTPGFQEENKTKPAACAAVEGTSSVFSPKDVAETLIKCVCRGDYLITLESFSWLLSELALGVSPTNNIFLQLLIAPFLPLIRFFTLIYIGSIGRKQNK